MSEATNTEQEKGQDQREPTPEEIKAYRASMLAFYKEEMPMLKQQNEYEKLKADIDENRLRSFTARIRLAHMMSPPAAQPAQPETVPDPVDPATGGPKKEERKLKTE